MAAAGFRFGDDVVAAGYLTTDDDECMILARDNAALIRIIHNFQTDKAGEVNPDLFTRMSIGKPKEGK